MPHRRSTWAVQWYSPGGASVHPYPIHDSLFSPESKSQTASRSVQPFCTAHGRESLYTCILQRAAPFPLKFSLSHGGSGPPSNLNMVPRANPSEPQSLFQTVSASVQPFLQGSLLGQTDRRTDRQTDHATRSV